MSTITRFRRSRLIFPAAGDYSRTKLEDGRTSARLCCPSCSFPASLEDHEIDAQGRVTPSVKCPHCDYHESGVVLDGWADA